MDGLELSDVPSYVSLNTRLGWKPTRNLELAIVGLNLIEDQHSEFSGNLFIGGGATEVERSAYIQATLRF